MLQQKKPDDYVIATGQTYSVKKFVEMTAKRLDMKIIWKGKGIKTKGYCNGSVIIECNKKYFRPTDVNLLLGNPQKAKSILKWKPEIKLKDLVDEMVAEDLKILSS